jgi:hypothetical protein
MMSAPAIRTASFARLAAPSVLIAIATTATLTPFPLQGDRLIYIYEKRKNVDECKRRGLEHVPVKMQERYRKKDGIHHGGIIYPYEKVYIDRFLEVKPEPSGAKLEGMYSELERRKVEYDICW